MMSVWKKYIQYFVFLFAFILAIIINLFSWQQPFFWDTLLTSSVTQFYFKNGFGNLILPNFLDAGHPPLFYIYVVLFYKILGQNLFAAHLSMLLPNLIGLWSLIKIIAYFKFDIKIQYFSIVGFFFIPAILTQQILVSYDTILLDLYLLGIYGILYKKHIILLIVTLITSLISTRGILIDISLFFILLFYFKNFKKSIMIFVPSALIFISWIIYHSIKTNTLIVIDNQWATQRQIVDFKHFINNIIDLCRIFFDFGIIILFIIQVIQIATTKKINLLQLFWIVPYFIMALGFIFISNPIGHRYFLVVYIFMLLASIDFLYKKNKKLIWLLIFLPLGHFQIYNRFSNGWDCTLTHLPYFSLRNDFNKYLKEKNIHKNKVGTVMPVHYTDKQYYLTGDTTKMININGENINNYQYILYTNICNDFSDKQLEKMKFFEVLKKEKSGFVEMVLYLNKNKIH